MYSNSFIDWMQGDNRRFYDLPLRSMDPPEPESGWVICTCGCGEIIEVGDSCAGSGLTSEDIKRLEGAFSKVVAEETGLPVKVRIETILGSRQELLAFLGNDGELTEEQQERLLDAVHNLERKLEGTEL